MKSISSPRWLAAFSLLAAAIGFAQSAVAGRKALDLLLAARYADLGQMLSPEAKALLTPEFLRDRAGVEVKSFGQLIDIGQPIVEKKGPLDQVSFPVRFSRKAVYIQITINHSDEVAGIHFRSQDDPLPAGWNQAAYVKPESFRERNVVVGSDNWQLGGTLTIPVGKGPFPALVLVHGPGPNDRDESIFSTRMFADLAEGLSSRGIAVLRYDKRSRTYGAEMSVAEFTLQEETIEDAVRALALLRKQPEVDPKRVFVLGHSLGGYAVPRIARQDGKLAGAILLAANGRPIEDVSLAQVEFLIKSKGGATAAEQKRLDQMKAEAAVIKNFAVSLDSPPTLLGLPSAYFKDLKDYKPAAEAARLGIPMLVLRGERDFQITAEDFAIWQAGLAKVKNVKFRSYPALNNLFMPGQGPASPNEYRNGGNVAPVVIDDIATWILR